MQIADPCLPTIYNYGSLPNPYNTTDPFPSIVFVPKVNQTKISLFGMQTVCLISFGLGAVLQYIRCFNRG